MRLSAEELESQSLKPETLRLAMQLMKINGYVLLEGILPAELVTRLYGAFMQVFEAYRNRTDPNRGANRYQMHLPFMTPFIDPAVITNPLAASSGGSGAPRSRTSCSLHSPRHASPTPARIQSPNSPRRAAISGTVFPARRMKSLTPLLIAL